MISFPVIAWQSRFGHNRRFCILSVHHLLRRWYIVFARAMLNSGILYLWLYYRLVDRELERTFPVDPSRQVGHPWYRLREAPNFIKHVSQHAFQTNPDHRVYFHNPEGRWWWQWPVVGLGLGGPEARLKRGALWWRHHNQPTVIITFDLPKIQSPKDMFLRLRQNWNSRRKCKRVFMIHNFESTESWEDMAKS